MLHRIVEKDLRFESTRPPSLLGPALAGCLVLGLSICGVGAIASLAKIQGAVAASGIVVAEGRSKKIQHEGGVVMDIFVDNGTYVREGDVLVRLDDTQDRAKLVNAQKQLVLLEAQRIRLRAERDSLTECVFPPPRSPDEAQAALTELALFHARRNSMRSQRQQLLQRIAEREKQIESLSSDVKSVEAQLEIAIREHGDLKKLLDQKYGTAGRVYQLEREIATLRGRQLQRLAEISGKAAEIKEISSSIDQAEADYWKDTLSSLTGTETKIAEFMQLRALAEYSVSRAEIKAPINGIVDDRRIHSRGEVVRPSDVLMLVVPNEDRLVIEARVAPQDIDQVAIGRTATVRFSNFNRLTTPELIGSVTRVSADAVTDRFELEQSLPPRAIFAVEGQVGSPYYRIRIELPEAELSKLGGAAMAAGMQVETFIATSERTVISYLTKPIFDRLARSMRER